ncbi:MAG: PAS domain S-box protein [Methanospirillaceae archaeon]|nr:PAS domain S-box protein [Methanospirillaceae archaeon]
MKNDEYFQEREAIIADHACELEEITRNVPGVVFRFSVQPDGEVEVFYVSSSAPDLLGISTNPPDFFRHFSEGVDSGDRADFTSSLQECIRSKSPWDFKGRFIKPSGDTIWFNALARPTIHGTKTIYSGIILDITGWKTAEEEVRQKEEKYRTILENIQDVFYRSDHNGNLIMISPSGASLLGYDSFEEMLGLSIAGQIYENQEDRTAFLEKMKEAGFVQNYEVRLKRRNGTVVTVSTNSHFYYDSDNNIRGVEGIFRDISEMKKAEESIRASETLYRAIFDNTGAATIIISPATTILLVNSGWEKLTGIPREAQEHMISWTSFVDPKDVEWMRQYHYDRRKDPLSVPRVYECRVIDSEKKIHFCIVNVDIIPGTGNSVASFVDITELKQAENALRENEYNTCEIIRGSPIPQFVIDRDHNVTQWNKALEEYSGIKASEVLNTNQQWRAFYTQERPCMADLLLEGQIEKIPQWYAGKFLKSPLIKDAYEATDFFPSMGLSGTWLHFTAAPIRDKNGETIGAVETLEDVTRQKKVEEEIKESKERLNAVIQGSPIPQFVIDRDHRITQWNRALEEYSGIKTSEVLNTNQQWRAFYTQERPCMADLLLEGQIENIPQWYEGKFLKSALIKDGYEATDFFPSMGPSGTWLHFTAAPVRDEDGMIIGAVETLEDVTRQKTAEEQIVKKADALTRSNAELEQFAYIASHDLQEPLRMIASYLQLIERRYKGNLDTDADEFIEYAVNGAKRLQNMINGLLDFSRIQTRGRPFERTDCETLLKDVITNEKIVLQETGATITHENLPMVWGDASQLTRVFQNLIENAIKFRGDEPPIIHVSAKNEDNYWIFSVKDNGIGFDPEYKDKLFILFRRLHNINISGTGIGLAVCKRIVERHGGKIWVDSAPGMGSTFSFSIPVTGGNHNERT